jgi:hypothetical protein
MAAETLLCSVPVLSFMTHLACTTFRFAIIIIIINYEWVEYKPLDATAQA